jgi:hypothetical protein
MWRVEFEQNSAIYVNAPDAESARLIARFRAWSVTGKWLPVVKVEKA